MNEGSEYDVEGGPLGNEVVTMSRLLQQDAENDTEDADYDDVSATQVAESKKRRAAREAAGAVVPPQQAGPSAGPSAAPVYPSERRLSTEERR